MSAWLFLFISMTLHAETTLFYNGKIYESYRSEKFKTEMRVENGRVVDNSKTPDRRVNLNGKNVFPSLTDAHAHLFDTGKQSYEIDVKKTKSPQEAALRVKKYRKAHPTATVLTGSGWDQSEWPGKKFSDRAVLDEVSNDIPIVLYRIDGHAAWVNTAALKKSGIWGMRSDPQGGKILRDERGKPAGVLIDNAMELLNTLFELSEKEAEAYLLSAVRESLSHGITSVHDAGIDSKHLPVFRQLLKSGKASFRFYEMLFKPNFEKPIIDELDHRFTVRTVKLFADGAMGSRGAAFDAPYSDDPGNSGLLILSEDEMIQKMKEADAKGFQIAIHAIGSKGTRLAINAMEKALGGSIATKRPRLEHAQILQLETIQKMKKLGIIASMQPTHCTSDMKWVLDRIGKERARYAYAWKTILAHGIPLAFGSDSPVESINPWPGIYSAMTRSNGESVFLEEEKITAMEALTAFSEGAAFAAFKEADLGTLTAGKLADFIVVKENPLEVPIAQIPKLQVDETYIGGKQVWKKSR
jgi:predicted amidohydrolase YtcJ